MDRDAERRAFAWACDKLGYRAGAKWTAYICATAAGLLYVLLLAVLGLVADLMVHRGRIPTYQELAPADQERLRERWEGSGDQAVREEVVKSALGKSWGDLEPREKNLAWALWSERRSPSEPRPVARWTDLSEAEQQGLGPAWDSLRKDRERRDQLLAALGRPWPELSRAFRDRFWLAEIHDALTRRVSAEAADGILYAHDPDFPDQGVPDLTGRGALGLVVRSDLQGRFYTGFLGWLARHNRWTWSSTSEVLIVSPYLLGLGVITLTLLVALAALKVLLHEMAARASVEAANWLRRAVYSHSFRLGTLAIRALGPSEAVTILTRHVEAVHDALYARLTVSYREPFKFVLLLVFALMVDPFLALAVVLCALLVWAVAGQIVVRYQRSAREATNRASERLTLIRESLMLMRLVKVYMMEVFNQKRVERQLNKYSEAQLRAYRSEAIAQPLMLLLGLAAAVVLLYVVGVVVLWGRVGVATVLAMFAALVSLYWPLQNWLSVRKKMRRGREAALQVQRFLERKADVAQVVGAEFLPGIDRRIEFDNVSLREPGSGRMLLQGVSLAIPAGKRVGIVGPEDLEKHALVYLIPRLLDPTSGEIRIDEYNLRWVTLDSLRDKIGMVMLHNLVFHDTVAHNIGCGADNYTLPQIMEAAKLARAHQFIQKLPSGYETVIGELGHSLTLAEQYRIALARAILCDPALVVLEEPTTELDDENKALIDDALARFLPGRTVIFIPHRVSTIKSCDRIFLLHRGKIEAAGPHRELLTQSALYKHLYYLEFSEMSEIV